MKDLIKQIKYQRLSIEERTFLDYSNVNLKIVQTNDIRYLNKNDLPMIIVIDNQTVILVDLFLFHLVVQHEHYNNIETMNEYYQSMVIFKKVIKRYVNRDYDVVFTTLY